MKLYGGIDLHSTNSYIVLINGKRSAKYTYNPHQRYKSIVASEQQEPSYGITPSRIYRTNEAV